MTRQFPSVPHPDMSDRYVMVDTNQVIANMADLGYKVADIRGPKFRTARGPYGYHLVDFRQAKDMDRAAGEAPRVVFINSYDGSTRAQVVAGVIRFICSNGMVVGDIVEREKVTHIGNAAKDLIERVSNIAAKSADVLERIGGFKTRNLTRAAQLEFANRATGLVLPQVDPDLGQVLNQPRRWDDRNPDLWSTFNRVQENLVRGGLPRLNAAGKPVVTRPIVNVQRDVRVNRGLWDLLEEFAEEQTV